MIDLTQEPPMSIAQVAAFMGVHQNTVRKWFDRGLDKVRPLGGRRIFTTRSAIQRFMAQGGEVVGKPNATGSQDDNAALQASLAALKERHGIDVRGTSNGQGDRKADRDLPVARVDGRKGASGVSG